MKTLKNILSTIVIAMILVAFSFAIWFAMQAKIYPEQIPSLFGYKPLTVLSGSMEPKVMTGDMVIVKDVDPSTLNTGDIVTYKLQEHVLVTHRIIKKITENGQEKFQT